MVWGERVSVHVIAEKLLLELLRRAHAGEDPDLLIAEVYANADHERHDPPDTTGGQQP